jgi:hypothetical protein
MYYNAGVVDVKSKVVELALAAFLFAAVMIAIFLFEANGRF